MDSYGHFDWIVAGTLGYLNCMWAVYSIYLVVHNHSMIRTAIPMNFQIDISVCG